MATDDSPAGPSRNTLLVHGDAGLDDDSSVAPPIYPSVTHRGNSAEHFRDMASQPRHPRYYTRYGNPTHERVEALVRGLEGAESALVLGSGMAAISSTVLAHVATGDHIVAQRSHYMGTTQLVTQLLQRFGVSATLVDQGDAEAFARAMRPETRLVLLETPSNPLLQITDLAAVAKMSRARGITTLADNTFATPINQRPLEFGIDLVVHSATKFLGGHHDLLAGIVAGPKTAIERVWEASIVLGGVLGAFDSWLLLRGLRTLALRVDRQNATALAVARFLDAHPRVAATHYPGLASHAQHALAAAQMRGFGGVLSFVTRGGHQAALDVMQRITLFAPAASLGGIESLAMHAATMWSGTLSEEQMRASGIDPGLIRLSVGLEDPDELIADLDRALSATG